jgi:LysM repeat protein
MKNAKIISLVVLLHAVGGAILFMQPGCKTTAGTADIRRPGKMPVVKPDWGSETPSTGVTSVPVGDLVEPTRPVETTTSTDVSNDAWGVPSDAAVVSSDTKVDSAPMTYKIQKGDTLSKIAANHGVGLQELLELNGLQKNSTIYAGKTLLIPSGSSVKASVSPVATAPASGEAYVVRKGDTLSKLAKVFGTSVVAIKSANGLSSDSIRVGQKLSIPGVSNPSSIIAPVMDKEAAVAAVPIRSSMSDSEPVVLTNGEYEVKSGDTLGGIAIKLKVSTKSLMQANGMTDPNRIFVGKKLKIPASTNSSDTTIAPEQTAPVVMLGSSASSGFEQEPEMDAGLNELEQLKVDEAPVLEIEPVIPEDPSAESGASSSASLSF